MIVFDVDVQGRSSCEDIKMVLSGDPMILKYGLCQCVYIFYDLEGSIKYVGSLSVMKYKLPYIRKLSSLEFIKNTSKIRCFAFTDKIDEHALKDLEKIVTTKLQPKDNRYNVKKSRKLWSYPEGAADLIVKLSRKMIFSESEEYSSKEIDKLNKNFKKHMMMVLTTDTGQEVSWNHYGVPSKENLTNLKLLMGLKDYELANLFKIPKRHIKMILGEI